MQLWRLWWDAIRLLRPGCTHLRTFVWFAVIVAGLTIRTELLGVTSLVRELLLPQRFYDNLLDNFHSTGIKLDAMTTLWAQLVLNPDFSPEIEKKAASYGIIEVLSTSYTNI